MYFNICDYTVANNTNSSMAATWFILFFCALTFYSIDGLVVPDVCSDNTLDSQQVLDFVANGKEWLTLGAIFKNFFPELRGGFYNPKFKLTRRLSRGIEKIHMDITSFNTLLNDCVTFQFFALTPNNKETGTGESCQASTGQTSDRFAVLTSPYYPGKWFRLFSQRPEEYAWIFCCFNSTGTSYDYDSCFESQMDLLIPDPRVVPTDSINVQEKVSALSGHSTTDDTRYIGNRKSLSVVWVEGDADKECNFQPVK